MQHELIWDTDGPEDLLVITHGVASIEGLDAWVQDALNDPRVRAGSRVLVDHRDLDWSPLSHSDIERRAELLARDAPRIGPGPGSACGQERGRLRSDADARPVDRHARGDRRDDQGLPHDGGGAGVDRELPARARARGLS